MTNSIAQTLITLVGNIVAVNLSEAATESYPYAVYDLTSRPILDKSTSEVGIEAELTFRIFSKDFDDADTKMQSVKTAIASGMPGGQYTAIFQSEQKTCSEEVWTMELNYQIFQMS